MLSTGCVAPSGSGVPTNPFACANLHLPRYGGDGNGWHVGLGWVSNHPILTSVLLVVVLTIAKAVLQAKIERS